jgi:hypothetical protein
MDGSPRPAAARRPHQTWRWWIKREVGQKACARRIARRNARQLVEIAPPHQRIGIALLQGTVPDKVSAGQIVASSPTRSSVTRLRQAGRPFQVV